MSSGVSHRRRAALLAGLGALGAGAAGFALTGVRPAWADGSTPVAGVDYTVLTNPQPTDAPPGKIQVLDFFWYGCPHCYAFLPYLEAWQKKLPPDVDFEHVPVAFNPSTEPHSRIFYSLKALGLVDEMHAKVFDAYHNRHMRLLDPNEIADFMAANGIPRAKWVAVYNSFSVSSDVNRANMMVQAYQIDGTPTLACDGRFLTSPAIASNHTPEGALAVMDYLIARVRSERARQG